MLRYIVTIETVKIKDFLFSTNKLRIIRGASYLLDYLNQVQVPRILEKNGVKEEDIIYIGAGNAKFFVDGEEQAKKIASQVKDTYRKQAPNSKVVVSYTETEYTAGGNNSQNKRKIWEDIDKLAQNTAMEKSKGFSMLNIDFIGVEKCEVCGINPVQVSVQNIERDLENLDFNIKDGSVLIDNYSIKISAIKEQIEKLVGIEDDSEDEKQENQVKKKGYICEECLRKLIFSNLVKDIKTNGKNISFYGDMQDNFPKLDVKTEISDYENGKSFIGFMYSDGDGLGDFLKNISEEFKKSKDPKIEEEYLKFLKNFSKALDLNTKEALVETIRDIFHENGEEKRFGEFLIVGGDDVCAVFNPELVLEVSEKFQKIFENKMEKEEYGLKKEILVRVKGNKITSSSGVIIAKSKTPAFQLFEQALKLQKSAKAKRYECNTISKNLAQTGFIDFQVIGSEGCVDIAKFRAGINFDENLVMERPYAINIIDAGKNGLTVKNMEALFEVIKDFKNEKFPKNKLRYIYELKRKTNEKLEKAKKERLKDSYKSNRDTRDELEDFEKKMEFINILSKMDEKDITLIKNKYDIDCDNYEFEKYFNNIFDIVELYDFIGGEADED